MEFKQVNNLGENKILIKVKGDFIDTPNNKPENIVINNIKYEKKNLLEKVLLISSLVANAILIYQFIFNFK